MRSSLPLALSLALLSSGVSAQQPTGPTPSSKEAAIRRLLEISGTSRMALQVMDAVITSFKRANPEVPEAFWAEFRSQIRGEELVDLCVPIYAKYLSEEDVLGIIAFYESPAGKRLLQVQPQIVQDAFQAGQQWGQAMAQKVIQRLKEKGYADHTETGAKPAAQ